MLESLFGALRRRVARPAVHRNRPAGRVPRAGLWFAPLLWLGLSIGMSAQEPDRDREATGRAPGQFRLGPLLIKPTIALEDLGIDTNALNAAEDPEADFTFTLLPQAEVLLERRWLRASVHGGPALVYYHFNESQRSINPTGGAELELRLGSRVSLSGSRALRRTRERLNAEVDARARRVENETSAGVHARIARKLTFGVTGRIWDIEFEEGQSLFGVSLRDTLTEEIESLTGSIRYDLTPLTSLSLTMGGARHRFPLTPLRDADASEVNVEAVLKPRALLSGEARVGYLQYFALAPSAPDFKGLTAGVNLRCTVRDTTQISGVLERSVGNSFQPQFVYSVVDRYGGSIRRALFRRIDVLAGTYREIYRFQPFKDADRAAAGDDEMTQRYQAEIGFRPSRLTRIAFTAAYVQRFSDVSSLRDYDGLRLGADVQIGVFDVRAR